LTEQAVADLDLENKVESLDGESIVRVKDLRKRFGNNVVLDGVDLSIERGKTTVVIGPSGCGKTVLIKNFIVLLRPTSGEVWFKDRRIDNLPEYELNRIRIHYGFLFQEGALFDSLSVAQNVMFPILQHYKVTDREKVDDLVKTKLRMVGLDGYQKYYPAKLSGGQRKRVALARAIAMNPEVILYDEPTTGLDPIRADIINELILKLQRELGETTIVVTHDMKSAYKIADRIVMLHEGKIIADGDAEHIRNHSSEVVQQFINGRVGEEDLDVLKQSNSVAGVKFQPQDVEEK
jgi:phospholipid/cholesterol/gamma-HCH transport system ATP-binding protein